MRGTRAKAIRRAVYGDQSLRQPRRYMLLTVAAGPKTARIRWTSTIVRNDPEGLRAKYQRAKGAA